MLLHDQVNTFLKCLFFAFKKSKSIFKSILSLICYVPGEPLVCRRLVSNVSELLSVRGTCTTIRNSLQSIIQCKKVFIVKNEKLRLEFDM